jgi:hypothetical protein
VAQRRLGHGRQPRLGALLLLLEGLGVRGSSSSPMKGAVDDRLDQVGLELFRGDGRLELERHRVEAAHAVEVAKLLLEVARHELLNAFTVGDASLVGGVEHADGESRFFRGERRIPGQRLAAAPERHLRRQGRRNPTRSRSRVRCRAVPSPA